LIHRYYIQMVCPLLIYLSPLPGHLYPFIANLIRGEGNKRKREGQKLEETLTTVYPNGNVCISILHPPGDDPLKYESASERWSPVQGVRSVLLSVLSMLAEPNIESGADIEVSLFSFLSSYTHIVTDSFMGKGLMNGTTGNTS